ncbi:reverse transcriptase family protein [Shewanella spartinae]|uniref:reverse transcriptase family protein n=1 Tax=Shewanella spartinae TaxID=2864205 RepID=UPI001C658E5E|nr:reverse transcriptase family protein [Shewanella spartinae]QYJ95068.1 reverse transcriptase family protein [Shewanella spartinae]
MKLDKKFFTQTLGLNDSPVKPIAKELVSEKKIGNKFAYSLKVNGDEGENILAIHNKLNQLFLNNIEINRCAKAFIKGRSYLDFIEPHRENFHFIRLDIKNFFHSIGIDLLTEAFENYFKKDYLINNGNKQSLLTTFINLVTYTIPDDSPNIELRGVTVLPIGFKLSPVISNIVFRKFDLLIEDYCYHNNITYSRYADDMIFSMKISNKFKKFKRVEFPSLLINAEDNREQKLEILSFIHSDKFIDDISDILSIGQHKFNLNPKKTIRSHHTISLNGYVIEGCEGHFSTGSIRLSNKKTHFISKVIHAITKKNLSPESIFKTILKESIDKSNIPYPPATVAFEKQYYRSQLIHKLAGYRSYIISFLVYDSKHQCIEDKYIRKYLEMVNAIEKSINKLEK